MKRITRKQIHIKVALMHTVKSADKLCEIIRNAIEKCDERVGGVEVTVVDVPMPAMFPERAIQEEAEEWPPKAAGMRR